MTDVRHLSEEERHGLADGSLHDEPARDAEAHLATCAECAADVRHLRSLMRRIDRSPPVATDLDALWPDIRSRIESGKVVPLQASSPAVHHRRWWIVAGIAAAAVIVAASTLAIRRTRTTAPSMATTSPTPAMSLSVAVDSVRSYRDEAMRLLDEMELRRATLPPTTRSAIDDDLRTIDDAIKELEVAIANDPTNPALRQLLASSYRQKVELLERIGNAG